MSISGSHDLLQRGERWIAATLRIGIWISAALMTVGLILSFLLGPTPIPDRNPSLSELLSLLFSDELLHPTARTSFLLMYGGLVCLMLTPFVRVLTAAVAFAIERDRRYVAISLTVFAMLVGQLIYSLF